MTNEDFLRDVCPNHTDKSQWNKSELLHILELHKEQLRLHIVSHCAFQIPTNWIDPLLTGKEKVLTGEAGQWGCPDIENLLRAIKTKIEHCGIT